MNCTLRRQGTITRLWLKTKRHSHDIVEEVDDKERFFVSQMSLLAEHKRALEHKDNNNAISSYFHISFPYIHRHITMAQKTTVSSEEINKLEWVQVRETLDNSPIQLPESGKEKLFRKVRENPLVPIGCMATVGALTYGLYNFYHGRSQMSQYMMRTRVIAQALTFVAIVTGLAMGVSKKSQ